MKITLIPILSLLLLISCRESPLPENGTNAVPLNYLTAYPALNPDSTVNAAIEIPAGTNDKWETHKSTGVMEWEQKNGKRRVVQYLPYPANYGMIPGTILPKEKGGDGDPLDILVLGPAVERGSVLPVKIIGVLRLMDTGEQDDKLIGVPLTGPFAKLTSMQDLEIQFPMAAQIIALWFTNYKGPGKMQALGFGEKAEAMEILKASMRVENRE
jgi:inorganic pyrophosphatase